MLIGGLSALSANHSTGYLPANRKTAGGRWGWGVQNVCNERGLFKREVLFKGTIWSYDLGADARTSGQEIRGGNLRH